MTWVDVHCTGARGAKHRSMSDLKYHTQAVRNDGDHDKFSHYVEKEEITKAFVEGTPVIALCGKIWVPTRDPEGFSVCPKCKEIFSQLS